jgi:hypothetical protein
MDGRGQQVARAQARHADDTDFLPDLLDLLRRPPEPLDPYDPHGSKSRWVLWGFAAAAAIGTGALVGLMIEGHAPASPVTSVVAMHVAAGPLPATSVVVDPTTIELAIVRPSLVETALLAAAQAPSTPSSLATPQPAEPLPSLVEPALLAAMQAPSTPSALPASQPSEPLPSLAEPALPAAAQAPSTPSTLLGPQPAEPLPVAARHVVTIAPSGAYLRTAPSLSSGVLWKAPKGTSLRVVGEEGNWLRVTTPSGARTGWMHRSVVGD